MNEIDFKIQALEYRLRELLKGRSTPYSGWEKNIVFRVYVRITRRILPGSKAIYDSTPTLDLANITVHPDYQGKGVFSRVLDAFERVADEHKRFVYVESVLEPATSRIAHSCRRRGYVEMPLDLASNFYRPPK